MKFCSENCAQDSHPQVNVDFWSVVWLNEGTDNPRLITGGESQQLMYALIVKLDCLTCFDLTMPAGTETLGHLKTKSTFDNT